MKRLTPIWVYTKLDSAWPHPFRAIVWEWGVGVRRGLNQNNPMPDHCHISPDRAHPYPKDYRMVGFDIPKSAVQPVSAVELLGEVVR